jgi:hypothetical protein
MTDRTPVEEHLSYSLTGALVSQLALHRGCTLTDLTPADSPLCLSLCKELAELGLDSHKLAKDALLSLVVLFSHADNKENLTTMYACALWELLGDPTSGPPPEIYAQAAEALHTALVCLLIPSA